MSRFACVLAAALGIPLAIYMIWHTLKFLPVSRGLHLHSIQPSRLWQRIKGGGEKVLVLDLLNYEEGMDGAEGIPTSSRMDPSMVRTARYVLFPSDLNVVLYCSSSNNFSSAPVALELKKHGVHNIEVLEGGFNAWQTQGLPMTHDLLSLEDAISWLRQPIDQNR